MNRRDRAVVAVLVLVLAGLTGSMALSRRPEPGQPSASATIPPSAAPPIVYREGVIGRPTSINPLTARNRADRTLAGLVFSGLVRLGPGDTLLPDLAASWTVDDTGTTWTFVIRADATWHDGVPVTAEDVVFTVEALSGPGVAGPAGSTWAEVTAVALDERTVQLALKTPLGGFLVAATQPLLPAHLLAGIPLPELATDPFSLQPVGSGPYQLTALDETAAVLERVEPPAGSPGDGPAVAPSPSPSSTAPEASPTPAPPTPTPTPVPAGRPFDRIELRFYDDGAALGAALGAGEIDAVAGLPGGEAATLAAGTGGLFLRYPTTTLSAVVVNLRPTAPELRDVNVRTALLAAIDRDALIRDELGTGALRADTMVPPGSWAFDATAAAPVAYDPARAAELLTTAGWTKMDDRVWAAPKATEPFVLELLTVPSAANPRLVAVTGAVASAWRAAGLLVTVVEVEAAELSQRLREGSFTAAVVDIAMGLEPDLYPLLASTQATSRGTNVAGYQDPGLDALLIAARAPGAPAARGAAWRALLAGLAARQPILPLLWADDTVVVRGVTGMTPRLLAGPGDRFWDVLAWRLAADR